MHQQDLNAAVRSMLLGRTTTALCSVGKSIITRCNTVPCSRYPIHQLQHQQRRAFSPARIKMSGTIGMLAEAYSAAVSPATSPSSAPEEGQKDHHRKGGGFRNPWPSWRDPNPLQIATSMLRQRIATKQYWGPDTKNHTIEVRKPSLPTERITNEFRATWLGHACYYVEFPGGLRVLFDPVFSERCSPVQWIGPKRYTKAPCKIEDIPIIDAVCISHVHYDHLDYTTVMQIKKHHPNAHFFVPLNAKEWFTASGIDNCTEMEWWEEHDFVLEKKTTDKGKSAGSDDDSTPQINGKFGLLPCQHQGGRHTHDQGWALWGSWSVESGGKKLYFAGDTGYRAVPRESDGLDDYGEQFEDLPVCPAFKQIGAHRGPFDLGLIPIGAYNPRWIMSPMHVDPRDAVNIFLEVKCKKALGMHWGTFVLTEEPVMEPPQKLREAMEAKGLPEEGVFDVVAIGEGRVF